MKTFLCLLRGINVGGAHKIKMAELRTLLSENGFYDITTYIQSGNILFNSGLNSTSEIDDTIHEILKNHYGYDLSIMTLTIDELDYLVTSNPFLKDESDFTKLLATIFKKTPSKGGIKEILEYSESTDDHLHFDNRFMYLHCPNGYGKTKLTSNLLERKLGTRGTTRNWKTLTKLVELSKSY